MAGRGIRKVSGLLRKIVIDKSAATTQAIKDIDRTLKRLGWICRKMKKKRRLCLTLLREADMGAGPGLGNRNTDA